MQKLHSYLKFHANLGESTEQPQSTHLPGNLIGGF